MSWRFFSPKRESENGIVLDIGSKSVGGGIFVKKNGTKPVFNFVTRGKFPFKKNLSGETLSTVMLKSLDTVLADIEQFASKNFKDTRSRQRFDSVTVLVSSPWHAAETKTLSLQFQQPSLITESVVEELLAEEERSFEARFEGNKRNGLGVLERKIVEMRINGYPTSKPYGKKATHLEVRMFGSVILSEFMEKIKNVIDKYAPEAGLLFHTFSVAAYASIRDSFPNIDSFLLVQVGGEVSDIAIIKRGAIVETESFPSGHNSLLRSLDKICHSVPECTLEGLIALHGESAAETGDQNKVDAAIVDTKTSWLSHFNAAISGFSEETFLPKTIFLVEENPYTALFKDFLTGAEASQFTLTAEPFIVNVVDRTVTASLAEFDKNVLPDEVLAMAVSLSSKTAS